MLLLQVQSLPVYLCVSANAHAKEELAFWRQGGVGRDGFPKQTLWIGFDEKHAVRAVAALYGDWV